MSHISAACIAFVNTLGMLYPGKLAGKRFSQALEKTHAVFALVRLVLGILDRCADDLDLVSAQLP